MEILNNPRSDQAEDFNWIWNALPKIKSFLWKMASNELPTCARLAVKGVDVVQIELSIVYHYGEDSSPLFLRCPFTTEILKKFNGELCAC